MDTLPQTVEAEIVEPKTIKWDETPIAKRPIKLPSFAVIIEPLTRPQVRYLSLRILGMSLKEAVIELKKSEVDPATWNDDKAFSFAEQMAMDHRNEYQTQAMTLWVNSLSGKAMAIIEHLVELGEKWDDLGKDDKSYVFRAANAIAKIQSEKTSSPSMTPFERLTMEKYG